MNAYACVHQDHRHHGVGRGAGRARLGAALAATAEGDEPGGPLQGIFGLLLGDLLGQGDTTAEANPEDDADPVPADVPGTAGAETPTTTAPAEGAPTEEAPAQEQPTEQAPSEGAPSSPTATEEAPVEGSPTAGTSEADGALP